MYCIYSIQWRILIRLGCEISVKVCNFRMKLHNLDCGWYHSSCILLTFAGQLWEVHRQCGEPYLLVSPCGQSGVVGGVLLCNNIHTQIQMVCKCLTPVCIAYYILILLYVHLKAPNLHALWLNQSKIQMSEMFVSIYDINVNYMLRGWITKQLVHKQDI